MTSTRVHATAIATPAGGLLLLGPPGSGKSDLGLRLVEAGSILVADDQVLLAAAADGLVATSPPRLAGLLEVRGIGLVRLPFVRQAPIRLALDLAAPPQRLPAPPDGWPRRAFAGVALPVLAFNPFEASAPAKALAALALLTEESGHGWNPRSA
ncbi:HPr kinase/phosphorylase [Thermaurantiacus sp.]